jgi:hypothetical protein
MPGCGKRDEPAIAAPARVPEAGAGIPSSVVPEELIESAAAEHRPR